MFDSVSVFLKKILGDGPIKEAHYHTKKKNKPIRTHPQLIHTTKNQYP
jgi:hypothetical protein